MERRRGRLTSDVCVLELGKGYEAHYAEDADSGRC